MVGLFASNVKYRRFTDLQRLTSDDLIQSHGRPQSHSELITQKRQKEKKKSHSASPGSLHISWGLCADWGVLLSCRVSLQTSLPMKSVSLQKWTPLHFTFPLEDKTVAVRCPSLMASISPVFVLMHCSGLSSPLLQWASRLPAPRGPHPSWFPSAYAPSR